MDAEMLLAVYVHNIPSSVLHQPCLLEYSALIL